MELAGGPQSSPSQHLQLQPSEDETETAEAAPISEPGAGLQHPVLADPATQARGRQSAGPGGGIPGRPGGHLGVLPSLPSSAVSVHTYRHILVRSESQYSYRHNTPTYLPHIGQDLSLYSLYLYVNLIKIHPVSPQYLHSILIIRLSLPSSPAAGAQPSPAQPSRAVYL